MVEIVKMSMLGILKSSRILQVLLHACPTGTGGCLGSSAPAPVGFKAHRIVIAHLFERAELRRPVDVSLVHRRSFDLSGRIFDLILAVAVVNSVLGQYLPSCREGVKFAARDRIAWIPVEREVRRCNRLQCTQPHGAPDENHDERKFSELDKYRGTIGGAARES